MISHRTATGLLVGILILILFLVYYVLTLNQDVKDTKFYTFITLLAGATSLFIAANLYFQAKNQEDTDQKALANSTVKIIKDLWLTPNYEMAKQYKKLGSLPQEMYPDIKIENEVDMHQVAFAHMIFQGFENYRTIYDQDETGLYVWLGNFLQWAQSDKLWELWREVYQNYKKSTYVFTEFLFETARELKEMRKMRGHRLSPKDYISVINRVEPRARQILETPEEQYQLIGVLPATQSR